MGSMRTIIAFLCLGLGVAACGGGDDQISFCDGPTRLMYDPPSGDYDTFPDDYYTVEDSATRTGIRVAMVPGVDLMIDENVDDYSNSFDDISTLDGFGTTGGITLRMSGPIDETTLPMGGDGSGRPEASVVLVDLDADPMTFVDFEWTTVVEDNNDHSITLVLSPVGPLEPKRRYGVAVTTRLRDPAGLCIKPSDTMKRVIAGKHESPRFERLGSRMEGFVQALTEAGTITGPGDLTAAVVFTTQSTYETSMEVAGQIRETSYELTPVGACVDHSLYRVCEGELDADDFRVDGRGVDDDNPAPQRGYTLSVTTWLPTTGTGPFPTLIFGHGLGGDRSQAGRLAQYAAPIGVATVAIDAVKHGDHPDQPESSEQLFSLLEFFGISIDFNPPLDGIALRDNFRQSTYDRLQLLEAIRPGVDVDGDGQVDLSVDQLGYLGVSLGGLMASEFLALAPEVGVALIVVPGAKVGGIIQHGDMMSLVVDIMRGTADDGQVARFFPMLQAIIDRGDPGAYTRHVVQQRLPGFDGNTPQVLMQMVLNDEVVPNVSNLAFAQGLAVPLVGDALLPIAGTSHEPSLPVSGNIATGVTAGVFQFDVVPDGTGLEPATHDNIADSEVGLDQSMHFLQTYYDTGTAELVDPYRRLGIKP